jgi:hypothetical protein
VLNMSIDPHLITMDLLFLAKIPQFRAHFFSRANSDSESAVEIFIKALTLRGRRNVLMTSDIIHMLVLMLQDDVFRLEMQQLPHRDILSQFLTTIMQSPTIFGQETCDRARKIQESVDVNTFLTRNLSPPPKMLNMSVSSATNYPLPRQQLQPKGPPALAMRFQVSSSPEQVNFSDDDHLDEEISSDEADEDGDDDQDDEQEEDEEEDNYDIDEAQEQPTPLYIHTPMRPSTMPSYLSAGARRKSATTLSSLSIVSVSSTDHNFDEFDISSLEDSFDSAAERGDDTDGETTAIFRRPLGQLQLQRGTSNGSNRSLGSGTPVAHLLMQEVPAVTPSPPSFQAFPNAVNDLSNVVAIAPPEATTFCPSPTINENKTSSNSPWKYTAIAPDVSPSPSSTTLLSLAKPGGKLDSPTKLLVAALVVLGFSIAVRYIQ